MARRSSGDGKRKQRKPLRRTAWVMSVGGLSIFALMLAISAYLVYGIGAMAGPGLTVAWPGGTNAIALDPPGEQAGESADVECAFTSKNNQANDIVLILGESVSSASASRGTLKCDSPAIFLFGGSVTVASVVRSAWIAVPGMVGIFGVLFFFPRFTYMWARASNPIFGGTIDRAVRRQRDDQSPFL